MGIKKRELVLSQRIPLMTAIMNDCDITNEVWVEESNKFPGKFQLKIYCY